MCRHTVSSKIVQNIGTLSSNSNTVSLSPGDNIDCTKYEGYIILLNINITAQTADFYLTNYKTGSILNIVMSEANASSTPVITLYAPSGGTINKRQSITIDSITYGFQIFIYDSTTAYRTGMIDS